jgi:hypothetical protein
MTTENFLLKIMPAIVRVSIDDRDRENKVQDVRTMLRNVANATFTNREKAKKSTGLAYLGGVNSSAKTKKGVKYDYNTFILYLAAADMSGFNICPMATEGCKKACLVGSGRARMVTTKQKINSVTWARLKKTWLYYFHREYFNAWLFAEIASAEKLARAKDRGFAVRLNGTSDISLKLFSLYGVNVLDAFPTVQFYDYTKVIKQVKLAAKYDNYDVTFSFANTSEHDNFDNTLNTLALGGKVSVVFDLSTFPGKAFPATFLGYEIANGDETDLTFLQSEKVLGLNFKKTGANIDDNKFVLSYDDLNKMEAALMSEHPELETI